MTILRPEDYEELRRLLFQNTGVVLEPDKQYLAITRLEPVIQRLGLPSLSVLCEQLRVPNPSAELRRQVIEAMLNGETLFFRDLAMFEMLRTDLLPRLISARASERRLVIWSAASSTGQEPYSLAMLLAQHFPILEGWDVQLLATDLSQAHLSRATSGAYSQYEINRGLPAASLVRWFRQQGQEWVIDKELRDKIKFSQLNLVIDWPPAPAIDLVLVRNVMIYWELETRRTVLRKVRHVLAPDGALVLGGSESMLQLDEGFEHVTVQRASYYRKSGPDLPTASVTFAPSR